MAKAPAAARLVEKLFFTLALFLLTGDFGSLFNFLSRNPLIRRVLSLLTRIPAKDITVWVRSWSGSVFPYSITVVFLVVVVMLFLRRGLLADIGRALLQNAAVALLVLLAALSCFWSVSPSHTLQGTLLVLEITVVALCISQLYSVEEVLDILVWVIALAGLLSMLMVWLMPERGIRPPLPYSDVGAGWQGIYAHKNYLGRLMAFGNGILVVYWFRSRGRLLKQTLGLALLLLTGTLLVFSESATSFFALMAMYAALILYVVWVKWLIHLSLLNRLAFALSCLALFILAALNYEIVFGLVNRSATLTGRLDLWNLLWARLMERPFLGFGYNAFWRQMSEPLLGWALHAHNGYLEVGLGLGFLGMILFVAALALGWKNAFSLVKENAGISYFWPVLALIYFTVANLTYSIGFERPDFHWALFVLVAGLVATYKPPAPEAVLPDSTGAG